MKYFPIIAWLILWTAAYALLPPSLNTLFALWAGATTLWIIVKRQHVQGLLLIIPLAVTITAFVLPPLTPSAWPPLLRLGVVTLFWSIVLGSLLRFVLQKQTVTHSPKTPAEHT